MQDANATNPLFAGGTLYMWWYIEYLSHRQASVWAVPVLCSYRTAFDNLKELRAGLEPAIDSLAAAKEALLVGFDNWVNGGGQQLESSQQVRPADRSCASIGSTV